MSSQPLWRLMLSAALMLSLGSAVSAQTTLPDFDIQYYVNPDASTPYEAGVSGGDGKSWDEAFLDLVEFLIEFPTLVLEDPGAVFRVNVASGTFYGRAPNPFLEDASFMIPDNLYIYGGYTSEVDRDPEGSPTVLSGIRVLYPGAFPECGATGTLPCDEDSSVAGCADAECCALVCAFRSGQFADCCDIVWDSVCAFWADVVCGEGSEKLVRAASVVRTDGSGEVRRLDGVTITGGCERPVPADLTGGGVLVTSQDLVNDVRLVIVRSRIEDNYAFYGGGVGLVGHFPPDCDGDGPNAEAVIWNCEIVDNRAVTWGGGVFAQRQAPYQIVNSVIARNGLIVAGEITPDVAGGALADFTSAIPNVARRIVNSTITRNFGNTPGITMNKTAQQNCTCENEQELCDTWDELIVINTVIRNNLHDDGQGNLVECVDPSPQSNCDPDAPPVITLLWCNVYLRDQQPVPDTWHDWINVDPGFVAIDPDPGQSIVADYRLLPTSAMIDAGTPVGDEPNEILVDLIDVNDDGSATDENLDLDLGSRRLPGISTGCPRVDIGAYEFITADNCVTGDFNDDCEVNAADLGLLLLNWS